MNTPPRILIVEDDAILATELQETLTQMGYQVSGLAATGKAAVESALAQKPDVILMDIRLRGAMTGIQAVEQIHLQLDIPVVYLTAFADEALLQQAKITDAYAYLVKPVRERELRAGLEMALYKHAAEQRLQHLNQILRAVRDVNQLITREPDAQRLMDEACQILLRAHGYQFVWIGESAGDRLKPLAFAGDGLPYKLLICEWTIHVGRIDKVYSQFDCPVDCPERVLPGGSAIKFRHAHTAESDGRNGRPVFSQLTVFHTRFLVRNEDSVWQREITQIPGQVQCGCSQRFQFAFRRKMS